MRTATTTEFTDSYLDQIVALAWSEQVEMHEAIKRQGLDYEKIRLAFYAGYLQGFKDGVLTMKGALS